MAVPFLYRTDLQSALVAGLVAQISAAHANGMTNVEYVRGVVDAFKFQVIFIGADWPTIAGRARLRLSDELADFLDVGERPVITG